MSSLNKKGPHKSKEVHLCDDLCHLMKMSLKHAYNMKKFELRSYWRLSVYFSIIGSIITLFFCIIFFNTSTIAAYFIEMAICIMGITLSHVWYKISLNNYCWHKDCYQYIKKLENQLNECTQRPSRILADLRPSLDGIQTLLISKSLNIVFFIFWCLLPLISLLKFFYSYVYVKGIALSMINALFLCIPFLIMLCLTITVNVFICMFSSKNHDEISDNQLDISLNYKNRKN